MIDKCSPAVYNIITGEQAKYIGGCKNEKDKETVLSAGYVQQV